MGSDTLIQVHGPVPTHQTLKSKLVGDATALGHEVFLAEGVPFSKYQSRVYANLLAKLIVEKTKHSTANTQFNIYEFGAGSGLLSKGILDQLRSRYPRVYSQTQLYISDICAKSLDDMQESGMFATHEGHVKFYVRDFLEAEFFKEAPPFFIYSTYLYDALPSHRIVLDGGKAYEILTETYLPKEADFIDVFSEMPRRLSTDEIMPMLTDSNFERRWQLRYQIGSQLLENYIHRPISESNFSPDLQTAISEYAAQNPHLKATPFSIAPAFFELMKRLAKVPNLTFFSAEVSFQGTDQLCKLPLGRTTMTYGLISYHALFWPLAKSIFTKLGVSSHITPREDGSSAEFLLETGSPNIQAQFFKLFSSGFSSTGEFTQSLKEEMPISVLKTSLLKFHQTVKGAQKLEFSHINNMANMLVKVGEWDLAVAYAKLLRRLVPSLAASSYIVFGLVARETKANRREEFWLTKGVHQFKLNRMLRVQLVNFYLRVQRDEKAIAHSQALLKLAERPEILTLMLQIALLYIRIKDRVHAGQWLSGILALKRGLKHPLDSDKDVFAKAEQLAQKL